MQEKILILDFGSQYTQLIARRVRELNVYCEIYPYNHYPALDSSVKGVILSGSPFSVRDDKAPQPDLTAIKGQLPLLGVCFGAQYLAHHFGGEVSSVRLRERKDKKTIRIPQPRNPKLCEKIIRMTGQRRTCICVSSITPSRTSARKARSYRSSARHKGPDLRPSALQIPQ